MQGSEAYLPMPPSWMELQFSSVLITVDFRLEGISYENGNYNSKCILKTSHMPGTFQVVFNNRLIEWSELSRAQGKKQFYSSTAFQLYSFSSPCLTLDNRLGRSPNFSWSVFRYCIRNYNPYINIMGTLWWQKEGRHSLCVKQFLSRKKSRVGMITYQCIMKEKHRHA